jgi:hypothetical protein
LVTRRPAANNRRAPIATDPLGRAVYANEIYDPTTRRVGPNGVLVADPFPGNLIPSSRFSPFQVRTGDILIVQEPYFLFGTSGTSHSTPWGYDTHLPVIFYGTGVKAGNYARDIAVNDVAPTLASLIGIEPPSGSSGQVLPEIVPAAR